MALSSTASAAGSGSPGPAGAQFLDEVRESRFAGPRSGLSSVLQWTLRARAPPGDVSGTSSEGSDDAGESDSCTELMKVKRIGLSIRARCIG